MGGGQMNQETVNWLINHGVTPRVVELAYETHQVRHLSQHCQANLEDVLELARRWGIVTEVAKAA